MNRKLLSYTKSDWIGIVSSGLCLIHCNVSLILILFGFNYSLNILHDYGWLDYVFLLVSFGALYTSCQSASSSKIQLMFLASFILLSIGILFHDDFKVCRYLSIIGSIGLSITHFVNIWHCKKCRREE